MNKSTDIVNRAIKFIKETDEEVPTGGHFDGFHAECKELVDDLIYLKLTLERLDGLIQNTCGEKK